MLNPRNPDLYQALKEYFKVACAYLSAKFESPEDLANAMKQALVSRPPYVSFQSSPPEDFLKDCLEIEASLQFLTLRKYRECFEQKGGYENVIKIMEKDKDIKKYFNAFIEIPDPEVIAEIGDAKRCLEIALAHFLKKLLDRRSLEFDEPTFDEFYKEVESFFYEDKIQYRCLAPLDNFQVMGKDSIPLEKPNLWIIKMPKPEDKWAIEYRYGTQKKLCEYNPFTRAKVALPQNPEEETLRRGPIKEIYEVCSALRLFKRGAVGCSYIWHAPGSWMPLSPFRGGSVKEEKLIELLTPYEGEAYILQKEEVDDFVELWRRLRKVRQTQQERMKQTQQKKKKQAQQGHIELALRRFNFGYQRERLDDKLIDWMIAFEALLLNEREELSYRLALRASRLLGRDPNERKEIFDFLREAYKQRSEILHGGEVKISRLKKLEDFKDLKDHEIFEAFVSKVEDYLRSAIIEFMKRVEDRTEDHVLRDLDDQIARGDCSIPPNQDEEG